MSKNKNIRLLDTFAGIGGFHLGVKQACEQLNIKFKCVGAIEFNKQSQETYRNNFPNTPLLGLDVGGDITKMDLSQLPKHNILCGGFPCQPFSQARHNRDTSAGIHATKTDNRAELFTYICAVLKSHKPKYVFLENVPGILKEQYDDGVMVIDRIMSEIKTCGYDARYFIVDASNCDAPQVRKRVMIVGKLKKLHDINTEFTTTQYKCMRDILEKTIDNKYLLKNLWQDIPNHRLPGNRYDAILKAYCSKKWTKPTQKQRKVVTSARVEGDTPSGHSRQRDRVFNSLGFSPTLTCSTPISISIDKNQTMRQLTPREYARIQCFPNTFKIPIKDGVAYKQFGNAVCVNMVQKVAEELLCR